MTILKGKLFLFSWILCFSDMHAQLYNSYPLNHSCCTLHSARFSEDDLCKAALINNDILDLLLNTTLIQFNPIAEEKCLSRSTLHLVKRNPFVAAAAVGDIKMVKSLFKDVSKSSCFFDQEIIIGACFAAAANGQLDTLKFLLAKAFPENFFFVDQQIVNESSIVAAAHGQLDVIKFLLAKTFPENLFFVDFCLLNACSISASANGHTPVVEFLFKKILPKTVFSLDQEIFSNSLIASSANGQIETLHFLFKFASSEKRWFLENSILDNCFVLASNNNHFEAAKFFSRSRLHCFR